MPRVGTGRIADLRQPRDERLGRADSTASRLFREAELDLAMFGEHAVARRFERGAGGEDYDVGRDCHDVGKHYRALASGQRCDFRIPVKDGGQWVESVVVVGAEVRPLLMVRTFIAGSPIQGFRLDEVARLVTGRKSPAVALQRG